MARTTTETTRVLTVNEDGEITGESTEVTTHEVRYEQEPDYVKLYIQTLSVFTDIKQTTGKVFYELVKLMSYAEYEQLVYLNPVLRRNIQNNLGIKQSMFDKALKELKDKGLIRKVANNTFSVNPDYVGRGKWRDIRRLRATFDFITGDVQTDFGYGEQQ